MCKKESKELQTLIHLMATSVTNNKMFLNPSYSCFKTAKTIKLDYSAWHSLNATAVFLYTLIQFFSEEQKINHTEQIHIAPEITPI